MSFKKGLIIAAVLVGAATILVIAVAIVLLILFRPSSNTVAIPGATAAGVPNGPATTKSIGPAGGSIASNDGRIVVDVPPNALTAALDFSIQSITNLAHGGLGNAYRLKTKTKFEGVSHSRQNLTWQCAIDVSGQKLKTPGPRCVTN